MGRNASVEKSPSGVPDRVRASLRRGEIISGHQAMRPLMSPLVPLPQLMMPVPSPVVPESPPVVHFSINQREYQCIQKLLFEGSCRNLFVCTVLLYSCRSTYLLCICSSHRQDIILILKSHLLPSKEDFFLPPHCCKHES